MHRHLAPTRIVAPALALVIALALGAAPVWAGAVVKNTCAGCQASQAGIEVDPASYKVWPSGSRTFLNAEWHTTPASATFAILNNGAAPSPPFTAMADVIDHNPLSEA